MQLHYLTAADNLSRRVDTRVYAITSMSMKLGGQIFIGVEGGGKKGPEHVS